MGNVFWLTMKNWSENATEVGTIKVMKWLGSHHTPLVDHSHFPRNMRHLKKLLIKLQWLWGMNELGFISFRTDHDVNLSIHKLVSAQTSKLFLLSVGGGSNEAEQARIERENAGGVKFTQNF